MKRRLVRIFSFVLILAAFASFAAVNAAAVWLSPLAESGDVSNNGVIEAHDARMILRASAKIIKLYPPSKWPGNKVYGDADGDGKLTAADARLVLRRSAGIEDPVTPSFDNEVEIFLSGKYHLIGLMDTGDGFMDWNFAVSGSNVYTEMELEGVQMGMLMLNGKFYLTSPAKKIYAEITRAEFEEMGVDPEDFVLEFPSFDDVVLVNKETVVVDDAPITILTYKVDDDTQLKFYLNGTKLDTIETYSNDQLASTIIVTSITDDVSKVLRVPSEYTKLLNVYIFMAMLMV
ncbi:MAG: dockerin type I domain-containing protein [Oscillospiraceae bacterium]|jgi:hypothetical protein|nr:dockerin type I domain-containing protein [Oscillospiraceae bacterium]